MKRLSAFITITALAGGAMAQDIIDRWDFNVADTNAIGAAESYSDLGDGGQTWPDKVVAAISNNTAVFFGDGTNTTQNYFSDASGISANEGAETGVYELSVDIVSADFTNTAAKQQKATWGIGFRGTTGQGSTDNGFRLTYEGGSDITNSTSTGMTNTYDNADHFFLSFDAKDVGFNTSVNTNFPGHTLSNLNVRQVYNLSNGTYQAYFTLGTDPETPIYSGDLTDGFVLNDLRIASQQNNGGAIWEAGDILAVDNIVLREIVAPDPVEPVELAGVLDEWLFDDIDGTAMNAISNSAPEPFGLGVFNFSKSWMYTTNGVMRYESSGTEAQYGLGSTSVPGATDGVYELSWTFSDALMAAGGDGTGATVGYGFRNSTVNKDTCLVRLLSHNSAGLRLQYQLESTQYTLFDFNTNTLVEPVSVRIVADYNVELLSVYYTIGDGDEVIGVENVGMPHEGVFDGIRHAALLKAADVGAGSYFEVDDLRLSVPVEHPTFVDVWDMDSNGVNQLSNNGLALPGSNTNSHQFAQTADDGVFIFAPTNVTQNTGKTVLSSPIVLTNGVAAMTLRFTEMNITNNSAEALSFGVRLWDDNNKSVLLKIVDQGGAASDAIRVGAEADTDNSSFAAGRVNFGNYGRFSTTGVVDPGSYDVTLYLDYENSEIRLGSSKWQWSPDGIYGVQTNVFDFAANAMTEFTKIQTTAAKWSAGDFITLDSLVLNYTEPVEVIPDTPESLYDAWIVENGYGSDTGLEEDADGNGVNNLTEYAIGGAANLPVESADGDYFYYVHVQWDDAEATARGLSYEVLSDNNLTIDPAASTNGVEFVGSVDGVPSAGYSTVTNRVPTTGIDAQFMQLDITFTP